MRVIVVALVAFGLAVPAYGATPNTQVTKLRAQLKAKDRTIVTLRGQLRSLRAEVSALKAQLAAAKPATPSSGSVGTRANPIPVGQDAKFNEWTVRVVSATPNANAEIAAENQFNDAPKPGHQFYTVRLRITRTGAGSESLFGAPSFSVVGASNVAVSSGDCGVIPDAVDVTTDVFTGGTVEGNTCFAVLTSDASSLVLYGSEIGSDPVFMKLP